MALSERPPAEIDVDPSDVVRSVLRELSLQERFHLRNGEPAARIRCDRDAPYRFVEPIMSACAKSGVWKVTFAVTRKDAG